MRRPDDWTKLMLDLHRVVYSVLLTPNSRTDRTPTLRNHGLCFPTKLTTPRCLAGLQNTDSYTHLSSWLVRHMHIRRALTVSAWPTENCALVSSFEHTFHEVSCPPLIICPMIDMVMTTTFVPHVGLYKWGRHAPPTALMSHGCFCFCSAFDRRL